ncbi:MAG: SpoIID/LytB domain-containing protein [Nitrospira sp.]|nr:SpoIID/LytB domain-containing protein [Nitrospira sp.]MCC7470274.1 SpoIID/LytB domain-containing protein [Candidatus Nomurabacteria bacterium]
MIRHRLVRLVAAVGMVCLLFVSVHPASAESIRVLLAQEAPFLDVRSDGAFALVSESGEAKTLHGPIHLTARGDGLHLDGRRLAGGQVQLRPLRHTLTLVIGKDGGGGAGTPLPISGAVRVSRKGHALAITNQVDLEEYVKGVVPAEVSSAWHPEMLKVQAVAARTYALYNKMLSASRDYDVVATIHDQVYRGRTGVDRRVEDAVESTRGIVVTHQQAPIYAAFSSTAAGPTEDAVNVWANKDLPYLKGVECPFDLESPYYQWKASVKIDLLEHNLRHQGFSVGTIATITPIAYSRAGRVARLRILHSGGETILRGEDLRKAAGYTVIPSTQFEVESIGADVVFAGYGAGHAVGLCQWGAKELAELGYSYNSILQYYYPGTELHNAARSQLLMPVIPTP